MSLVLAAALASALVQQPRPFGHVIGDVVTQRVLLDFEPAELPRTERVSVWFERQPPRVDTDAEGRRWLSVSYQIVNSPQSLTTVTLPSWTLDSRLEIPAWPLSVGPLTPRDAFATGGLQALRPDRAAPAVATAPLSRQIVIWLTALVMTVGAWFAWWLHRNRRAYASLPFARAMRALRGVEESTPQAWQTLHRAFDETAGRVVQSESLGTLFHRAPHLASLQGQIERFFTQSARRFFGDGAAPDPISVHTLCADLRRLEKRHER